MLRIFAKAESNQHTYLDDRRLPTPLSVKNLGFTFDTAVTWKNHIIRLKKACSTIPTNFSRKFYHKPLVQDCTSLLRIYRPLIQLQIDYGVAIALYTVVWKNLLHSLNTIHHTALQLATDAFPTQDVLITPTTDYHQKYVSHFAARISKLDCTTFIVPQVNSQHHTRMRQYALYPRYIYGLTVLNPRTRDLVAWKHFWYWPVRKNRQLADITPDTREEIFIEKVRPPHLLSHDWAFSFFLELRYWPGIWILHNSEFLYYYFSAKTSNSTKFVNERIHFYFSSNNICSAKKVIFYFSIQFLPAPLDHGDWAYLLHKIALATIGVRLYSSTILKIRHSTNSTLQRRDANKIVANVLSSNGQNTGFTPPLINQLPFTLRHSAGDQMRSVISKCTNSIFFQLGIHCNHCQTTKPFILP